MHHSRSARHRHVLRSAPAPDTDARPRRSTWREESARPTPTRRDRRQQAAAAAAAARRLTRARRARRRLLAATVMAAVTALATVPLLVPLTPEPALATDQPARPAPAQSFIASDVFPAQTLSRGDYQVVQAAPAGTESYEHTADTFVNDPNSPVQWPFRVGVPISSTFGYRISPCPGCSSNHPGLDMTPGIGTPIQAMADGVVTVATEDGGGYGVYVVIRHEIDGQVVDSAYAHMLEGSIAVQPGQTVKVGQLVGRVGNTGNSTGPHLHFEVRVGGTPVDPMVWLPPRVRS